MKEIEILSISLVEWIGYIASTLILISLSLSSIVKLRIVNLFGAALFSFYGFYIGSLPVGLMNFAIVLTNLFYLQKLYFQKDKFELIEASIHDKFIQKFIAHFKKDIHHYFPDFEVQKGENQLVMMVMRNMNFTGLFIANKNGEELEIELDYVTPQFRDFKNGAFFYSQFRNALIGKEFNCIVAKTENKHQSNYLKKMGFSVEESKESNNRFYLKL